MTENKIKFGKPGRGKQKSPEQYQAFGRGIKEGKSLYRAMLDAGWSENSARKGNESVSKKMMEAVAEEYGSRAKVLECLADKFTPEQMGKLATARLIQNVVDGEDRGHQSAKLLGQRKGVDLFNAGLDAGIFINVPPAFARYVSLVEEPKDSEPAE